MGQYGYIFQRGAILRDLQGLFTLSLYHAFFPQLKPKYWILLFLTKNIYCNRLSESENNVVIMIVHVCQHVSRKSTLKEDRLNGNKKGTV